MFLKNLRFQEERQATLRLFHLDCLKSCQFYLFEALGKNSQAVLLDATAEAFL